MQRNTKIRVPDGNRIANPNGVEASPARFSIAEAGLGAIAEALDFLPLGIMVVGAEGEVLHTNRRARDMGEAKAGLAVERGRVVAEFADETAQLIDTIGQAARGVDSGGKAVALSRMNSEQPLSVMVVPLRRQPEGPGPGEAAAVLFIGDPDDDQAFPAEHLMILFGLTRAEAALTLALLQGRGLEWAARQAAIGMNTARTHLKRVFDKTGTHRQAELVRLVLKSPAILPLRLTA